MNKKILMCKDGSDILEYEKIQNKIEYYFNNKKIDRFDLLASAANSETDPSMEAFEACIKDVPFSRRRNFQYFI